VLESVEVLVSAAWDACVTVIVKTELAEVKRPCAAFVAVIVQSEPASPGVKVATLKVQVPEVLVNVNAPDPDPPDPANERVLP
jgi:hypothetical protein